MHMAKMKGNTMKLVVLAAVAGLQAAAAGVEILCYDCLVTERSMYADRPLPVLL